MQTSRDFQDFMKAHENIVHKVCRLYTNDQDEFEDYFQEVTIQLWKSLASFKGASQSSTWVFRVAINTCLGQLRKKKRNLEFLKLPSGILNIGESYSEEEYEVEKMYEAIKKLSEIERAIVMLYLEDKSYQEIAEIMGLSMSNVGVKINRIKTKLKKIING